MPRQKIRFKNHQGEMLAALLETPAGPKPRAYALFAHCFTCSKDIAAASRISRSLAENGIATLRFDFTGLGNSDGDFSNTNFSSNLQDLISAADYLHQAGMTPSILIGHSLGGAAVLAVSSKLDYIKAVITIAAPATGKHIEHLFVDHRDTILSKSRATVDLAGRLFTIKKQFLTDIDDYANTDHISKLGKALLVFHSPLDQFVSISEAAKIYRAAKHPKSFISLDKADHLLSNAADAEYVATLISTWISRYLDSEQGSGSGSDSGTAAQTVEHGDVLVSEIDHAFLCDIRTADHALIGDEPLSFGGQNKGPSPFEFLLSSLGLCTAMTIRMVAEREKMPLVDVHVYLEKSLLDPPADKTDAAPKKRNKILALNRRVTLKGDLNPEQRARLMLVADRCPVHKSLSGDIQITTEEQLAL